MEKEFTGDLILLRGIPGSGKSTLAHIILEHPANIEQEVLSNDDFFINEYGEYKYDSSKLMEAQNYCQFRCSEKMRIKQSRIVVANPFINQWELDEYFNMAESHNYRVHSIIVENRHGNENIHGIPEDEIIIMKENFEIKL